MLPELVVTRKSCLICLTLSIISRRILPFAEMTLLDVIPHNNFFCNNLGVELTGIMAITTDLKVIDNADRSPRGHTDKPKSNIQFLTMMVENNAFLLPLNIMKHKRSWRDLSCLLHLARQYVPLCINIFCLGVSFVSYNECMHLVIDLNPASSRHLFYPLVFHKFSNLFYIIPSTSCGINVRKQHIVCSYFRV